MCAKTKTVTSFSSLIDLVLYFKDDKKCLELVERVYWKDGIRCPYCGCDKIYRFSDNRRLRCSSCREYFSLRTGTIFENSRIPLVKWFMAMYLISANKRGISSVQLAKDIQVTQSTAWFVLHRIREAMTNDNKEQMEGIIECDESFVGGKNKNRHKDKKAKYDLTREYKDKTPVLGILNRSGDVRCFVVPNTQHRTTIPLIKQNVKEGSTLMTDEWYSNFKGNYEHYAVNHTLGQYGYEGGVHINTMEGFWTGLKKTVGGTYYSVSRKHLQRYCDEVSFRYNTRNLTNAERFEVAISKIGKKLSYSRLVGNCGKEDLKHSSVGVLCGVGQPIKVALIDENGEVKKKFNSITLASMLTNTKMHVIYKALKTGIGNWKAID
jgi:transposase-like protein